MVNVDLYSTSIYVVTICDVTKYYIYFIRTNITTLQLTIIVVILIYL